MPVSWQGRINLVTVYCAVHSYQISMLGCPGQAKWVCLFCHLFKGKTPHYASGDLQLIVPCYTIDMRVRNWTALEASASLRLAAAGVLTLLSFAQAWDEAKQQEYK
jgi:hypothetical protein